MWANPQFPADLFTFAEEIFNGELCFLCCEDPAKHQKKRFLQIWLNAFRKVLNTSCDSFFKIVFEFLESANELYWKEIYSFPMKILY